MRAARMERYWNRRAREDAFHYVDSRQRLGTTDQDAFWRGGEEVIDRMLSALEVTLRGDEDVIEIGCGVGRLTRVLAGRARSVHAFDVSAVMLEQAQTYNRGLANVHWIHGDGKTLAPCTEGRFDACISFVVFQHLPDPEMTYGYVREMGRVLRVGGWAAFQVSTDPRVHKRLPVGQLARRWARALPGMRPHNQHPAWRGSAVEIPRLTREAAGAGLALEQIRDPGSQFCLVLARREQ